MKEKIIFSRKMAYELRKHGFNILRVEPNPYKPEFDCYIFEETQELCNMMNQYSKK